MVRGLSSCLISRLFSIFLFFFFNDTATTEIYTLSLHDALPIWPPLPGPRPWSRRLRFPNKKGDRKSTRLNSSHLVISYAVFCLKKKKKQNPHFSHNDKKTIEQDYDKHKYAH